jgi:hypothetical protein
MSGRSVFFVMGAALIAVVMLGPVPPVLAGPQYHAPQPTYQPLPPAPPPPTPHWGASTVSVSVAVNPTPRPAPEPYYVNIRGPDGQVRRFPVEGGPAAIQSPSVVVLRPGQSVTIRWVAAK